MPDNSSTQFMQPHSPTPETANAIYVDPHQGDANTAFSCIRPTVGSQAIGDSKSVRSAGPAVAVRRGRVYTGTDAGEHHRASQPAVPQDCFPPRAAVWGMAANPESGERCNCRESYWFVGLQKFIPLLVCDTDARDSHNELAMPLSIGLPGLAIAAGIKRQVALSLHFYL